MSIPKNAKRVFKGVMFDVYQWKQKMFDGNQEVYEAVKRPDTVEAIVSTGNKILIQKQRQPQHTKYYWTLPAGKVDPGEKPLRAMKRELLEECGYTASRWMLWRKFHPAVKVDWSVFTFIARNGKYKQKPQLENGEKITTHLISFDQFLKMADDPRFYSRDLNATLIRARFDAKVRKKLHRLIFGK